MKKAQKFDNALHGFQRLHIKKISEPQHAMRTIFDREGLEELAASIKKVGLIQPITVVLHDNKYEVVVGHRRLKACKLAGVEEVPAIIIEDSLEMQEAMKVHENIIREDVNVVDEANFLRVLMKRMKFDAKKLAKHIGKSEAYVSLRLAINNYASKVQDALYDGKINVSVARELHRIDDEKVKRQYLNYALDNGCSPAIMKQWADTYITLRDQEPMKGGKGKVEVGEIAGGKVMVQCIITKEMFPIEETGTFRINLKTAKDMGIA